MYSVPNYEVIDSDVKITEDFYAPGVGLGIVLAIVIVLVVATPVS